MRFTNKYGSIKIMKTLVPLSLVSIFAFSVASASYQHPEVRIGEIGGNKFYCSPAIKTVLKSPDWTPGNPLPTSLVVLQKKALLYVREFLTAQDQDPDRWLHAGSDMLSLKGSGDTKWIYYMRYKRLLHSDHIWVAITLDGNVIPVRKIHKNKQLIEQDAAPYPIPSPQSGD